MPERVTEIVEKHPIPMVLHGGTGPDRGAVRRPHRARLRQGQHLDRAQDRVRRRPPRVSRRESRQARPALVARPRARGGQGRGGAPHPHLRLGGAGSGDRLRGRLSRVPDAHLRLRRRAGRHGARRPPARVQPGVRGSRPARELVRGGVRRAAARSAAARSGSPRSSTIPGSEQERIAALHKRKTAIYKETVRAGRLPGRPGVARIVDEALAAGWTLAVASTSAEESVRAVLEHVVGCGHRRAVRRVRRRHRAGQEARSRDLPARARASWASLPPTRSSSRTRATACSPPSARACAAS